jgi:hypothetical protein
MPCTVFTGHVLRRPEFSVGPGRSHRSRSAILLRWRSSHHVRVVSFVACDSPMHSPDTVEPAARGRLASRTQSVATSLCQLRANSYPPFTPTLETVLSCA